MTPKYMYLLSNLTLIWCFILFYGTNHYYVNFLRDETQHILLFLATAYTIYGILFYFFKKNFAVTHAYVALVAITRWLKEFSSRLSKFPETPAPELPVISGREKTSILFLLIKILYLPMMLNFLIGNYISVSDNLETLTSFEHPFTLEHFSLIIFPFLINGIFLIEVSYYVFGYTVESTFFDNTIKSVEPTIFGWLVTLSCYPPFNGFMNNYVLWYSTDFPSFTHEWQTITVQSLILVCFIIYLWSAISLGAKCSNLTNRGIVTTGAFSYVRHPAYISKNLAWWLGLLPNLTLPAILSMSFWSLIYFLRAITEEHHLIQDPDYQTYCKKVRYRFIPYIY